MIAALVITVLLAFAAGWAVCNDLKDRRAERAEARAKNLDRIVRDDCEADTSVREIARPLLGDREVDGDSYGVPPLEEITRALVVRARRAEEACEELRQQVMRGAEVARWTWPTDTRRTNADAFYFHVKTTKGDLLLTDEALSAALERATKLLRHDTPRP
jgi:hypothetical protein